MAKNVKCKLGERYCFAQDESSHWYLVPTAERELFDAVLYEESDPDGIKFDSMFSKYMLRGDISCYSFLAPECDF